jgi:hypothetical protein
MERHALLPLPACIALVPWLAAAAHCAAADAHSCELFETTAREITSTRTKKCDVSTRPCNLCTPQVSNVHLSGTPDRLAVQFL